MYLRGYRPLGSYWKWTELMADVQETQKWHLKKEIQVTHLLTTFAMLISAVMYVNKMEQRLEQRLTILEQRDISARERMAFENQAMRESMARIQAQLDRIERQLARDQHK